MDVNRCTNGNNNNGVIRKDVSRFERPHHYKKVLCREYSKGTTLKQLLFY